MKCLAGKGFWFPSPDERDWYIYYEQYAGVSYGLSMAPGTLVSGQWQQRRPGVE
jgi:hypothetical protein